MNFLDQLARTIEKQEIAFHNPEEHLDNYETFKFDFKNTFMEKLCFT